MRADVSSSKAPSKIPELAISQISLLPNLPSSRLSVIISSYKVHTDPIYSLCSLLLAPVSLPCLTNPGELQVVDD